MLFLRQLGVDYCYTWLPDDLSSYEYLARLVDEVSEAGLTLYNVGNMSVGKSPRIHLGAPGRDEDIARFLQFLRDINRAGIKTTTFTWEPDRVWSSAPRQSRFAKSRYVDLADLKSRPLTQGRETSLDELWRNFEYFMRAIIPAAEETGVRLALHPNDPPTDALGGIPCLINSRQRYDRAFAIADSPSLGMEFCTGCWLEGGKAFGDMLSARSNTTSTKSVSSSYISATSARRSPYSARPSLTMAISICIRR